MRPPRFIVFNGELKIYSSRTLCFQNPHKSMRAYRARDDRELCFQCNQIIPRGRKPSQIMIICASNQDLVRREDNQIESVILGYLLMILLLIELELKHRIEGLDVLQNALRISNDTRLMETSSKTVLPSISLMTFSKPENEGQGKGFGGLLKMRRRQSSARSKRIASEKYTSRFNDE